MILDFILVIFFTVVTLTLAYYIIRDNNYRHGTIFVVALVALATLTYWSLGTYRGYPAQTATYETNEMIYGRVDRPTDTSEGRIFLWLRVETHDPTIVEKALRLRYYLQPRAFEIPYTDRNAGRVEKAIEQIKKGYKVQVNGVNGNSSGTKKSDRSDSDGLTIKIVDPREVLIK